MVTSKPNSMKLATILTLQSTFEMFEKSWALYIYLQVEKFYDLNILQKKSCKIILVIIFAQTWYGNW